MARQHNREAIGARLRFEVLRRCNFACYYCGVPASLGLKVLHIDHVTPVDLGGTNDPWNLVAAYWDCNAGKSNSQPPADLVAQVRADFETRLAASSRGAVCVQCNLAFTQVEGEEGYDRCSPCVDRDISIYNLGWDSGARV